jgi:hypothetical protein
MAAQRRLYLPQALSIGELSIKHAGQMRLGTQRARIIAAMLFHKAVMDPPRKIFRELVKHDILMRHGLAPFRVQMPRKQLETSRINAVRPFKHKLCRTGVGLTRPSRFQLRTLRFCLLDGRLKGGHECVREDALSAGWKSPPRAVTACEVESNCAAAMRGGEQLEAKE